MPSPHQWWITDDEERYHGPYATRDEAIFQAQKQGIYNQEQDQGNVNVLVLEAQSHTVEDLEIDPNDVLDELESNYEEYTNEDGELFADIDRSAKEDLGTMLNQTFQMWARDHDIKLAQAPLMNERNQEFVTFPKPE
jgi:hypothetical protein